MMHIVFTVVGAVLGGTMQPAGGGLFGALVGAFIGYAIAEFTLVRGRVLTLEGELARLRSTLARRAAEPPEPELVVPSPPPSPPPPPPPPPPSASATGPRPPPRPDAASRPRVATPAAPAFTEPLEELRRQERAAALATPAVAEIASMASLDELRREQLRREQLRREQRSMARATAARVPDGGGAAGAAIRGFFTGGNALVRAGVIVLFFGVAFLLRYVTEHTHVPIEVRLAGVASGGIVLLGVGWSLRKARPGYALALQGGGVGILYLTIFAALHLYALLPPELAFGVLAALAGLSAVLAVLQNSQAFALLAATGGFLAPLLASTGQDQHVVLFSYYAVLNAAIVAIAWFKAWRPLNLAGFVFTFVIGTAWGVLQYRAAEFATTEPFLVLFFLFYVAVAVLNMLRQTANLRGYVDATLVFGPPIVAFGLQSAMLHDLLSLAYSAVAVSALYLALAWILHRRRDDGGRMLAEAFVALGVAFLTLAVPLALDSRWNAAAWALEGSALIWIGCRQGRRLPRVFGALLIVAAGCVAAQDFDFSRGRLLLQLGTYLGVLTVSGAALVSARTLHAHRERLEEYEQVFGAALFLWGLFWWLAGGSGEILRWVAEPYLRAALLGFAALTALGSSEYYLRTRLGIARAAALFLLPVMLLFAAESAGHVPHPFAQGGWLAWPAAFLILYVLARRHEGSPAGGLANTLHVGSAWLLCAVLSWETAWVVTTGVHGAVVKGGDSWRAAAWALWPVAAVFYLPRLATRVAWPFRAHREAYLFTAGVGLGVYLGLWSLTTNLVLRGDGAPLPYVPLLNALDIAQAFVFAVVIRYWMFLRAAHLKAFAGLEPRLLPATFGGLVFIWANGILLRTLHQWGGVPFTLESFAQSTLTQTSLSIFWASLALTMMLVAARKSNRPVWLAGAALLTVVVAKLFLVDLSRIGSIERIISFVGVGLLMLIVGYLSPLPPAVEPGQRR